MNERQSQEAFKRDEIAGRHLASNDGILGHGLDYVPTNHAGQGSAEAGKSCCVLDLAALADRNNANNGAGDNIGTANDGIGFNLASHPIGLIEREG